MAALSVDARALFALGALLLLPGLLVVRSPWTFVPFLSLGFWLVTWLVHAAGGRAAGLLSWLGLFALFVLLRLPRLPRRVVPRWPSLLVSICALAELVPLFLWAVPPGSDGAFFAWESRLLAGADRIPPTDGPFGAVGHLLASAFGVPALAADMAVLGAVPPERAVLLVGLAARGLLTVALYAFARRIAGDERGAVVALVAGACGRLVLAVAPGGEVYLLAGALVLAALALLVRGEGNAPAVAAGLLLAGALVADPWTGVVGICATFSLAWVGASVSRFRRLLAAMLASAALAGEVLWWGIGGLGPLGVEDTSRWCGAAALLVAFGVGLALSRRRILAEDRVLAVACAIVVLFGEAWWRHAHVPMSDVEVAGLRSRVAGTRPLARICIDDDIGRAWLPALTGHAVEPPWTPPWVPLDSPPRPRHCTPLPVDR